MVMLLLLKNIVSRITAVVTVLAKRQRQLARAWSNRSAIRQLNQFDDHALKDIGLTRDDVAAAMDTPFFGRPLDTVARGFDRGSVIVPSQNLRTVECRKSNSSSSHSVARAA